MYVNRDTERATDSPIGQSHAFTVTVGELKRQLGFAPWIGYTHHHAISLLARDAGSRLYDAAGPSDPYLHASPGDQVGASLLSGGRLDVRSVPGAERIGLRSGTNRLFD